MSTSVLSQDSSLFEDAWLRSLMAQGHRPNVLVQCSDISVEATAAEIVGLCGNPFHMCLLPGRLPLPAKGRGTLLIWDVSTLTLQQQITLCDWMGYLDQRMQVISITSVPLLPLVEDGHFLEGLFYRLNIVHVKARSHASSPRVLLPTAPRSG